MDLQTLGGMTCSQVCVGQQLGGTYLWIRTESSLEGDLQGPAVSRIIGQVGSGF